MHSTHGLCTGGTAHRLPLFCKVACWPRAPMRECARSARAMWAVILALALAPAQRASAARGGMAGVAGVAPRGELPPVVEAGAQHLLRTPQQYAFTRDQHGQRWAATRQLRRRRRVAPTFLPIRVHLDTSHLANAAADENRTCQARSIPCVLVIVLIPRHTHAHVTTRCCRARSCIRDIVRCQVSAMINNRKISQSASGGARRVADVPVRRVCLARMCSWGARPRHASRPGSYHQPRGHSCSVPMCPFKCVYQGNSNIISVSGRQYEPCRLPTLPRARTPHQPLVGVWLE